jgi:broad specificity phosphatase PhoE/predicted kinase
MPSGLQREKLVLAMVGLPARGKTYTARKIARYLQWSGYRADVFNVGEHRRARIGPGQPHEFFDPENREAAVILHSIAMEMLDRVIAWLDRDGDVAIYDATNSTHERRAEIRRRCAAAGVDLFFIENVCTDPVRVEDNIRATKVGSPDYAKAEPDAATADFRRRIEHYEKAYQPVGDDEGGYIRSIDAGTQMVVNRLEGYLPSRLVYFLMNLHLSERPIWLARHGESIYNISGRIGGDADLAPRGERFARSLASFIHQRVSPNEEIVVWSSSLRRTIRTAEVIERPYVTWRALDEIDAGICDGMTYDEIKASMPEEYAARAHDKFRYRYPRGESYQDVIQRLDSVIVELERQQKPVLVIAHQAVLRALYAYFTEVAPEDCPFLPIPLHAVIELRPHAYGCEERRIALAPLVAQSRPSG